IGLLLFAILVIVGSRVAFEQLGMDPFLATMLVFLSLILSSVNLPAGIIHIDAKLEIRSFWFYNKYIEAPVLTNGSSTRIFFNVGGAVIPFLISIGLIVFNPQVFTASILAIIPVTIITYRLSRVIPGRGIGIPLLILPVIGLGCGLAVAGLMTLLGDSLSTVDIAIIVYTATTVGTLLGADILNLAKIKQLRSPFLAIGGAGTFDGVFLVGILATLVLVIPDLIIK
ncbi:MAG: DUF1614 domain-containing protein, partial [Candidatus Hodarchaeales archaeon]